jgi:hypothetical protein
METVENVIREFYLSQLMAMAARRGYSLDEQFGFAEMLLDTMSPCLGMN